MLGLFKRKCKRGKFLARAEPNETTLADGNIRLEYCRVMRSDSTVHAVGRDDEIGIGEWLQFADFCLKVLLYAERTSPFLEDIEQPPSADPAEAMTVRTNRLAPKMHVDGVPVMKIPDDRIMRFRVRRLETRHRLIREYDTPPKRIVRSIALVNLDFHAG